MAMLDCPVVLAVAVAVAVEVGQEQVALEPQGRVMLVVLLFFKMALLLRVAVEVLVGSAEPQWQIDLEMVE
jgi:hypothetical protein